MKHLLNNLTEEEKNSIREQHTGGMNVVTENFSRLIKTKSGDVKPLINEEEDEERNISDKVDQIIKLPKVQNRLENIVDNLSEVDKENLKKVLDNLGIDEMSSAKEVHSKIKNMSNNLGDGELEEDEGKEESPKEKVARILHSIGAGNIALWGGVPVAIGIGSMLGMPLGFAISWGTTTLLMGIAKLLGHEITERDLSRITKRIVSEQYFEDQEELPKNKIVDEVNTKMDQYKTEMENFLSELHSDGDVVDKRRFMSRVKNGTNQIYQEIVNSLDGHNDSIMIVLDKTFAHKQQELYGHFLERIKFYD
jgi:predicted transcriptional regulator